MTHPDPVAFGDDPLEERVVESDVVHRGRYLEFRVDTIERADGSRGTRDVVGHPGAVSVLALDDDGRILFVRQWRIPAGRAMLEIPAGTLDVHEGITEDPDGAARRELEEETGHRATTWRRLASFWTAPGFASELMHLYLATGHRGRDRRRPPRPRTRTSASSSSTSRSTRRWPGSTAARSTTRRRCSRSCGWTASAGAGRWGSRPSGHRSRSSPTASAPAGPRTPDRSWQAMLAAHDRGELEGVNRHFLEESADRLRHEPELARRRRGRRVGSSAGSSRSTTT